MSSSESNTKIDLLEPEADVISKIKKAFAEPGKVEDNGLLAFTKRVLFPLSKDGTLTITREEKHGGNMVFKNYAELETAYAKKDLFPLDLKNTVANKINELLAPIRAKFDTPELQALIARAYPTNVPEQPSVDDDLEEEEEEAAEAAPVANVPADTSKTFYKLDLRVGQVTNIRDHPDAESLYIFDANIGEAETVQVVTNLKKDMAKEELEGKLLVFLCNLKPTSFRGAKSLAMIMGGTNEAGVHGLLTPQGDAKPGDRLSLKGQDPVQPVPARANEKVIAANFGNLSTNAKTQFTFEGIAVTAGNVPIVMPNVTGAKFSAK